MEQVSISTAYMWALVIMAVMLLLAVLAANAILYKPMDPGTTKRRVWFWVLAILTPVLGYLVNWLIASGIQVPNIHARYLMHSAIAAGVALVLYIALGFVISKVMRNTKVGTWF